MAGYAQPRQPSRDLLDSFSLDVLLDLAYGMIIQPLDYNQRDEFVKAILDLDSEEKKQIVERKLSDGRVVQISEARLKQIQRNAAGMGKIKRKRRGAPA